MNIAFVGNYSSIKGSQIFRDLVLHYGSQHNWHVFGVIHDKSSFFAIKKQINLAYPYEDGELPKLLTENKIDLVLLLSTWPETFSKVFFEAVACNMPIISFGLGFPGARFPNYSGFSNFERGVEGLIEKIDRTPLNSLKEEVSDISKQLQKELTESSERKFELIDKLLS